MNVSTSTIVTFRFPLTSVAPPTLAIVTKSPVANPCAVEVIVANPLAITTHVIFVATASALSFATNLAISNIPKALKSADSFAY